MLRQASLLLPANVLQKDAQKLSQRPAFVASTFSASCRVAINEPKNWHVLTLGMVDRKHCQISALLEFRAA